MSHRPNVAVPATDVDVLVSTLEVRVVQLLECLVSQGWRMKFPLFDKPGIHYNLKGEGQLVVGDFPPIELVPHTLVIVPANQAVRVEAIPLGDAIRAGSPQANEVQAQLRGKAAVERLVAGDDPAEITLVCGYFDAMYGTTIDLFASMTSPIVERFVEGDDLSRKLVEALAEVNAKQVGMDAMAATLLKQVFIALIRRSMTSHHVWMERFGILGDPKIARVFAEMLARPGAPHTIASLAQAAHLSRSAFMGRFTGAVGHAPATALRQIRMRRAATLLSAGTLSVEAVARTVGYASRSSFFRAFRTVYGQDPQQYRAATQGRTGVSDVVEP